MGSRPILTPTAGHPITVEPTGRHVTVRIDGDVIAETDDALTLREADYPAVHYIPLTDVVTGRLRRSDTTSYCPYKGEAGYFHVDAVEDAIWTYEQPYPAVSAIAGYVAFYPNKAEIAVD